MDLISPSFRRGDYALSSIHSQDLYLVIRDKDKIISHLQAMQIGEEFIDIARTYFQQQGNYVRLTNPGKWGIPWDVDDGNTPHVLFTYTALYFYAVFCGELYKKKFSTKLNPFHIDSDVITVASFGTDCTVPYLVAGVGLGVESGTSRPIDFLLPNHFLALENSKFSTSRGHAIWGSDIINKTPVSSDAVRYFLAWKNPENEMCDFNVEEFIGFINQSLAGELQSIITRALAALNEQPPNNVDEAIAEKLEGLLITQLGYLTPPGFQLKNSILPLKEWINFGSQLSFSNDLAYWWLKGFALLSFPIMPDCSISLWHLLGHQDSPNENIFFQQTKADLESLPPGYFSTISFEEIKPALPATLF